MTSSTAKSLVDFENTQRQIHHKNDSGTQTTDNSPNRRK